MAEQSQAENTPASKLSDSPQMQRIFGREVRTLSRNPKFVADVLSRRAKGEPLDKIAKELKCHRNTVMNILAKNGGDPLDRVKTILTDGLPKIADMVIVETLRKKDVRAGVELLRGAGQLEALRPKPAAEDGGRIVIEWSGAPPPWAPPPVLAAYAKQCAVPPKQVPAAVPTQVVDVEVVDAENGEARQQS